MVQLLVSEDADMHWCAYRLRQAHQVCCGKGWLLFGHVHCLLQQRPYFTAASCFCLQLCYCRFCLPLSHQVALCDYQLWCAIHMYTVGQRCLVIHVW